MLGPMLRRLRLLFGGPYSCRVFIVCREAVAVIVMDGPMPTRPERAGHKPNSRGIAGTVAAVRGRL